MVNAPLAEYFIWDSGRWPRLSFPPFGKIVFHVKNQFFLKADPVECVYVCVYIRNGNNSENSVSRDRFIFVRPNINTIDRFCIISKNPNKYSYVYVLYYMCMLSFVREYLTIIMCSASVVCFWTFCRFCVLYVYYTCVCMHLFGYCDDALRITMVHTLNKYMVVLNIHVCMCIILYVGVILKLMQLICCTRMR